MRKMITVFMTFVLAVGLISTTAMGAHPIGNISSGLSVSGITVNGSSSATATNKFIAGTLTLTVKGTINGSFANDAGSVYAPTKVAGTDSKGFINSCSASATAKNFLNIDFRCGYVNGTYKNSTGSISSNRTIKLY